MNATIKLWHERHDDYTDVEPDQTKEIEVTEENQVYGTRTPPIASNAEVWHESYEINNHKYYAISLDCDSEATLFIHTSDSVHGKSWSKAVEGGLHLPKEHEYDPYGCDMWGKVCMWVKEGGR
jgi:hypothetical protein